MCKCNECLFEHSNSTCPECCQDQIVCPFCRMEVAGFYPIIEIGDYIPGGQFNCPCDRFSYDGEENCTIILDEIFPGYPKNLVDELMKFSEDTPLEIISDFIEERVNGVNFN